MGEDKPCWLVKGKQPFLVFQNQVISGNIVGELAATLELTIHAAPGFPIDAEIAFMYPAHIAASGFEIFLIRRVKHRNVLVQNSKILLLKHHAIFAKHLVAVFVVLAVLCHFVDEEQGQTLDAHIEELFLFFKVGEDGFSDLNAAHILFGHIAHHITGFDDFAVGKGHGATQRVNFGDGIPLVLLHFLRNEVKIVPNTENTGFPVDGFVIANLQLDFCHRRLLAGKNDLLKVEVAVRATEVLDLKALDLDFLDQPLVEGVQRIQHIDEVVMLGVGSRVVEREQRIEVFQRLLRHIAAHLLWLVQNNDRTVCLDNIDRAAGAKFIPFGVDDTGFFALTVLFQRGGKRLRVDDHHIDAGAARKVIQLVQVGAVVDEEASLLAVVLHKVVCGDFKGLLHALTDRNGGNDHDKLAPAVLLVQLEHRLDIDVGFARAGFHFNIKAATPQVFDKGSRELDIVLTLQGLNVVQKLFIGKLNGFVFITGIVQRIDDFKLLIGHTEGHLIRFRFDLAPVTDIADLIVEALSLKDTHNSINRIGLVLLYFEIKFHCLSRASLSLWSVQMGFP